MSKSLETIANSHGLPHDERIQVIDGYIRAGRTDTSYPPTENQLIVSRAAVKELITIPGYADRMAKKVNDARDLLDRKVAEGARQRGAYVAPLYNAQEDVFPVLALVPTVDSVRVLGSFLHDERGVGNGFEPGGE